MALEEVVLVNKDDHETGTMEKIEAHRKGLLHRAFSVFVTDSSGNLLLQKRALEKYHSPGLWTNTCCSHPRPGEPVINAAERRLFEEMGLNCSLEKAFSFIYKAGFSNGLTEHEYDHVLIGESDEKPFPDPEEVAGYEYFDLDFISRDMEDNPEKYTVWFRIAYPRVKEKLKKTA